MATSKKKPNAGRPATGRTEYLQIRVSPEEKEAFEVKAKEYGLSLSDWARFNLRACSAPKDDDNGKTVILK